MRKWTYFDKHDHEGWPAPEVLAPYFSLVAERSGSLEVETIQQV
jgi:hypothetical protein